MKIHHLSCGSMCPKGSKIRSLMFPKEVCCHCLLIESHDGLILVDTGLGTRDFKKKNRLGSIGLVMDIKGSELDAAVHQVRRLGFSPSDVRHIIVTHLHPDHSGGILDFPLAQIHVLEEEFKAAVGKKSFFDSQKYRDCHWSQETKWVTHKESKGEQWFGFQAVRDIPGIPPEVLLVPLRGHTEGHLGVAIKSGKQWLLHAGDSYYDQKEITEGTVMTWELFQKATASDYKKALYNRKRLAWLHQEHQQDIKIICSHDPDCL